jgi:hypothetical protein
VLQTQHGNELPYAGVLCEGFPFRGRRVPFLNYQKGTYRAAVQRGPAALSIQTSSRVPYADAETEEPEPVLVADLAERRYVVRETKVRLHQARFRGAVLPAYRDQCTICRLKEVRLLDAAHINADVSPNGSHSGSKGSSNDPARPSRSS